MIRRHARQADPVCSYQLLYFLYLVYSFASLSPIFRIFFQVPYPVTPLFATLTKTAGVCTNNSQNGTFRLLSEWNVPAPVRTEQSAYARKELS